MDGSMSQQARTPAYRRRARGLPPWQVFRVKDTEVLRLWWTAIRPVAKDEEE